MQVIQNMMILDQVESFKHKIMKVLRLEQNCTCEDLKVWIWDHSLLKVIKMKF